MKRLVLRSLMVDLERWESFQELARREGISVSEWCRRALDEAGARRRPVLSREQQQDAIRGVGLCEHGEDPEYCGECPAPPAEDVCERHGRPLALCLSCRPFTPDLK